MKLLYHAILVLGGYPFSVTAKVILSSEQSNIITVSWKNQISDLVRNDDHLMVVFYNVHHLILPIETEFTRKDELAKIVIPENSGKEIYLYLFFKGADEKLYSIDQVFKIAIQ